MRLKTLNGAPLCEQLDFSESSLLNKEEFQTWSATASSLKWRSIAVKDLHLHTGWSQPHLPGPTSLRDESNLTFNILDEVSSSIPPLDATVDLDTTVTFDDQSFEADGFLQQSFIFHDTLLSSQVLQDDMADKTVSSSSFLTTSFSTSTSGLSSPSRVNEQTLILEVPSKMTTTPLGSLPSAQRLRSIYPQTPTPNFLCVLMTSPEQREILVRKGAYKMVLWEITVADDTCSGFKVTFWIRPPQESNNEQTRAQNALLQTLGHVRIGDILLLRNIALTSFRDTVYGQSLNSAITRARTSIDVLMGNTGIAAGQLGGLPATVVETFMRVKRWARTHVAAETAGPRKRKGAASKEDTNRKRSFAGPDRDESLPPDTMEAV